MSEEVMRKHIDLYVNNYSIALGQTGKDAVRQLLKVHQDISGTITAPNDVFSDED
jgi:1,4-dihydroxy-6-naphthoate synthase